MQEALNKYKSLKPHINRCNEIVLDVLNNSQMREAKIVAESFKNGGKRLRPALLILSSMTSNGGMGSDVPEPMVELAAAVELIHLATLFHDDVIDENEERRTTLNARLKYGNYAAVLAGDYALAEALLLVHRSGFYEMIPDYLRTVCVLISGESREAIHKFDFDLSEAMYYEIISEKSASLFGLSCKVGGMSHRSELTDVLGHFGWNLGMSFQMIDDLDDMLELPTGAIDCDLRNGYLALPIIRVLAELPARERQQLVDVIRKGDFAEEETRRIITLCTDCGSIEHTKQEIDQHLNRAGDAIERFEKTDARDLLAQIVNDLRQYSSSQVERYSRIYKAFT